MKSEVYEESMPVYAICSNSVLFVVTCVCVKKNNYKKRGKEKTTHSKDIVSSLDLKKDEA